MEELALQAEIQDWKRRRRSRRRPAGRPRGCAAPGIPYSGSPATGRSIAARWTRIWCVRPVSSRTRSSAWRSSSSSSSKCVTAARGVAVSREWRSRSRRSRPIGASIVPRRDRGLPDDEREVLAGRAHGAARVAAAARAPPASARRRAAPTCPGRGGGRSRAASSSPPSAPASASAVRERAARVTGSRDGRRRRPACRRRGGARPRRRS